jgi:hypothetical protein
LARLQALTTSPLVTLGGHYRLEIADEKVPELLSFCSANGVRLQSLNPVRFNLEDYFVELLRSSKAAPPEPQRDGREVKVS